MLLVYTLIFLFGTFILYCFVDSLYYNCYSISTIEGLENNSNENKTYQPYNLSDPNNCLILAQQNAGNIEVLKTRLDEINDVKPRVDKIQESIDSMQTQINNLVQQQSDFAQDMAGSTPPDVTGIEPETTEDVEDELNNK